MPQKYQFVDGVQLPVNEVALKVVIAYNPATEGMVANMLTPQISSGGEYYKYLEYSKSIAYDLPETEVGTFGKVNRISYHADEKTGSTKDHAIEVPVSNKVIQQSNSYGIDPMAVAGQIGASIIARRREVRVAEIFQNANNFDPAQVAPLSGTDQFDHADSKPYELIQDVCNSMPLWPGGMVVNKKTWMILSAHEQLVTKAYGKANTSGVLDTAAFARLFGLKEVLVGDVRYNVAKPGLPEDVQNAWGNNVTFYFKDPTPILMEGIRSFVISPWWQDVAVNYDDPEPGMRGIRVIKVGKAINEHVTSPDYGYLLQTVLGTP